MRMFLFGGGEKYEVHWGETPEKVVDDIIMEDFEGLYDDCVQFDLVEITEVASLRVRVHPDGTYDTTTIEGGTS